MQDKNTIGLNKGELGLVLGDRGVGKTDYLINMSIKGMFNGLRVLHVSIDDVAERIESHYEVKIKEAVKEEDVSDKELHNIGMKKTILSYLDQSFDVQRLDSAIKNLGFRFDIMVIDGLQTADMALFSQLKDISQVYGLKTWISYPLSSYKENEDKLNSMFKVIIKL